MRDRAKQSALFAQLLDNKRPAPSERGERASPPSDVLLARICAVIDLLVTSGLSEEGAAQVMTRRMIGGGVSAPKKGTARIGWKRLLAWKAEFQDGLRPLDAIDEYRSFAAQIEKIPAQERVERVSEDELWNRRRSPSGKLRGARFV